MYLLTMSQKLGQHMIGTIGRPKDLIEPVTTYFFYT